jgi:hypothetical protein
VHLVAEQRLERIAALVDWARFERLLREVYAAPVGRPSYGPVLLLKCLLLQQWYRLSDPGLEEALSDRLSLRRFVAWRWPIRCPITRPSRAFAAS